MQLALKYTNPRACLAPVLLWLAAAVVLPTEISNFDFRHISFGGDSLTISFSKSSPPLAAIEDEKLPTVRTEPVQQIKLNRRTRLLIAGTMPAWPKLHKYSRYFEKKSRKFIHHIAHVPFSKKPVVFHAVNGVSTREFKKRVYELTHLVVKTKPIITHLSESPAETAVQNRLERHTIYNQAVPVAEVAQIVTQPQVVQRVAESPLKRAPTREPALSVLNGVIVSAPKPVQVTPVVQARPAPPDPSPPTSQPQPPPRAPDPKQKVDRVGPANLFKIIGQVELTGGLAVLGQTTKLNIQWRTGSESRDAQVDYSTGKFILDVPTLSAGKVIAELYDQSSRLLGTGVYDLDEVVAPGQTVLEDVKIVIEARESLTRGRVLSAYSVDKVVIPVKGSEVLAAAGNRVPTAPDGGFKISGLSSDSTFFLEAFGPGHWVTRQLYSGKTSRTVPIFPFKMLQSFYEIIGHAEDSDGGLIWGQVTRRGKPIAGVEVSVTAIDVIGPIYFNALRIPDKTLKKTSDNGLFAFVKVKPGFQLVMAHLDKIELPSSIVDVASGSVSYAQIDAKAITLMGRVYDPISQRSISAQLSVLGASKTAQATVTGFQFKIPSSDPVVFVDAHPGSEYLVSREAAQRSELRNLSIFVFKKAWVDERLREADLKYDESKGLLVGYIDGPNYHVQLDENSSDSTVLYLDTQGHVVPGSLEGIAGGSAFMMPDLKPGMHTLVITSAEGDFVTSRVFVSEPGLLNVLNMPLRP